MADVIDIALYAYKGLYLTSGLYALFLAMCAVGLIRWQSPGALLRVATACGMRNVIRANRAGR